MSGQGTNNDAPEDNVSPPILQDMENTFPKATKSSQGDLW
jgi:hypothetical protein